MGISMNIANWERDYATRLPSEVALIHKGNAWTNSDLHRNSGRLARAFVDLGVRPGDRIAIALSNCPELFVVASAAWQAGAVVVIVADSSPRELSMMVHHSGAVALVAHRFSEDVFTQVPLRIEVDSNGARSRGALQLKQLIESSVPIGEPIPRGSDDIAQLCYTSGSTGTPKAAIYTHGARNAYWRVMAEAASPTPRISVIVTPPTAFGAGLIGLRAVLNRTYVLLDKTTPLDILAAIQDHKVAEMSMLPTTAEQLLVCKSLREYDCSSLDLINIGGAQVGTELIGRLQNHLGRSPDAHAGGSGLQVRVHYALTEAGGGVSNTSSGGDGIVGRPVPGVEIRIEDESGGESRPGAVGEILVRSPFLAAGYWGGRDGPAPIVFDGYLRTGDVGYLNPQGELCLVGRLKDIIIQGGYNVNPTELCTVIGGVEGVRQCAVVGVPNSLLGEEVVACVVRSPDAAVTEADVRERCQATLDPRKMPCRVLFLDQLPVSHNGKTDVRSLRESVIAGAHIGCGFQVAQATAEPRFSPPPLVSVSAAVFDCLAEVLPRTLDDNRPLDLDVLFGDMGLDSIGAVRLSQRLSARLNREVSPTVIYAEPTARDLISFLHGQSSERTKEDHRVLNHGVANCVGSKDVTDGGHCGATPDAVAIVGIGCRLGEGVDSAQDFWQLLVRGGDATSAPPVLRAGVGDTGWRAGFLGAADYFDAPFFKIADPANLDPRHRMVLEVGWEALEDAGEDPLGLNPEGTGVFLGIYGERYKSPDRLASAPGMAVSYLCQFLNIRGPVVSVDTTCSSSLVALHLAASNLRSGDCDLAIAGGVSLLSERIAADALGILASDGRCKTFSAKADGFGQGEGCVLFALKREADARAAGDRIYALIRGGAINHDGRSASLTAPNPIAQAQLIARALKNARVDPEVIQYVEAHGTGTQLGDPIEIEGLSRAFQNRKTGSVRIGSVKANLGHLEAAAGAVGVAKVALALMHRWLPASLHCRGRLNENVAWNSLPIKVQRSGGAWPIPTGRLMAGVSSFGMSGTNAHLILSDAQTTAPALKSVEGAKLADPAGRSWLLPLSAGSQTALVASASAFASALDRLREQGAECRDIAFTASCGRAHLSHRVAVTGRNIPEWVESLQGWLSEQPVISPEGVAVPSAVVAIFTGVPSQWRGAGRELFVSEPTFRDAILECARTLSGPESEHLIAAFSGTAQCQDLQESQSVALFALQVALITLWRHWGIDPVRVFGVGLGTIAAAYAGGRLRLHEAVQLASEHGHKVLEKPPGNSDSDTHEDTEDARTASFRWHAGCAKQNGPTIVLQLGPCGTLSADAVEVVQSLREGLLEHDSMTLALSQMYCGGQRIKWRGYATAGVKVTLPLYPWDHASHWRPQSEARIERLERRASPQVTRLGGALSNLVDEEVARLARIPVTSLDRRAPLTSLGLDSLAIIRLQERLSDITGHHFEPGTLSLPISIEAIIDRLGNANGHAKCSLHATAPPLAWLQRRGSRPTHVWIHPVGGGIDCYGELSQALPFKSAAIASPGLRRGAALGASVEAIAQSYITMLEDLENGEPVALAGWSFGGLVAYEMAAQMQARGRPAPLVVLIDTYLSPHGLAEYTNPTSEETHLFNGLVQNCIGNLPSPEAAHHENVIRANLLAARKYRPPIYDGETLLLRAANPGNPENRALTASWRHCASRLRTEDVDADHESIMRRPALERVVELMSGATCSIA
jgi:acyl-CoA synthetase (AMP-forming)/AMP-acid ligase II/3-oxoacyl-(acyl-carrier-protein) synthase/thioesterase domain-containing protein/aryl carrier-like protein